MASEFRALGGLCSDFLFQLGGLALVGCAVWLFVRDLAHGRKSQ